MGLILLTLTANAYDMYLPDSTSTDGSYTNGTDGGSGIDHRFDDQTSSSTGAQIGSDGGSGIDHIYQSNPNSPQQTKVSGEWYCNHKGKCVFVKN